MTWNSVNEVVTPSGEPDEEYFEGIAISVIYSPENSHLMARAPVKQLATFVLGRACREGVMLNIGSLRRMDGSYLVQDLV